MIVSQVEKTTFEYLSLAETVRRNGDRHKANGDRYLAEGKLQYAAGSYRKAAKNYERSVELEWPGWRLAPKMQYLGLFDLMSERLEQDIADSILYGVDNGQKSFR